MLAVVAIGFTTAFVLGGHYGFGDLLRHFDFDLYQLQADGFRAGQLGLAVDPRQLALSDLAPVGVSYHLSQGPFPAVVYALLDTIAAAVGVGAFPKVLLFVLVIAAHLGGLTCLLRGLLGGPLYASVGLMLLYASSFPFVAFARSPGEVHLLAIAYASASYLWGIAIYIGGRPGIRTATLSSLLLVAALLCRPLYAVPAIVFAFFAIARAPHKSSERVFAAIVGAGVVASLLYNYARFDDVLNFGERFKYHGIWEEVVYDFGVIPWSTDRLFEKLSAVAYAYLGLDSGQPAVQLTSVFKVSHRWSLWRGLNVGLIGLVGGAVVWAKTRRTRPLPLLLGAATIPVIGIYVVVQQSVELRYALDMWPAVFVLAVKGINDLGATAHKRAWWAPAMLALAVVAWSINWTGASFAADGPKFSDEPFSASVLRDRIERARDDNYGAIVAPGTLGSFVGCNDLTPVHADFDAIKAWREQDSIHRLGLYRFADGRCEMLFFSGATLTMAPELSCSVELVLDAEAIDDCAQVSLYLDGVSHGPLETLMAPDPARRHCGLTVPPTGRALAMVYFLFGPTDFDVDDLRRDTKRYRMHQISRSCGAKQGPL